MCTHLLVLDSELHNTRPVNLGKNWPIGELIATFCFFLYLQYLGCPVSHTKSLEIYIYAGKVRFGGHCSFIRVSEIGCLTSHAMIFQLYICDGT